MVTGMALGVENFSDLLGTLGEVLEMRKGIVERSRAMGMGPKEISRKTGISPGISPGNPTGIMATETKTEMGHQDGNGSGNGPTELGKSIEFNTEGNCRKYSQTYGDGPDGDLLGSTWASLTSYGDGDEN